MEKVISADGTTIAFDRHVGRDAETVILIGGAFSYRASPKMVDLAETLAARHGLTVINYDRRGRGDPNVRILAPAAAEFLTGSRTSTC